MKVQYAAFIEKSEDGYAAVFPDWPGCVAMADTMQELAEVAAEVLEVHIDYAQDRNAPLPDPTAIDALPHDPEVEEVGRMLVGVEVPGRAVKVTITMPEDVNASVERFAKANGFTKSGLLTQAVREKMQRDNRATGLKKTA